MTTPNGAILLPAKIDISASGDNIVIPAGNRGFWIWRLKFLLDAQTTVTFKAGARVLSGPETCTFQILDFNESQPWYVCGPGEAFIMSLGDPTTCGGTAWYLEQP